MKYGQNSVRSIQTPRFEYVSALIKEPHEKSLLFILLTRKFSETNWRFFRKLSENLQNTKYCIFCQNQENFLQTRRKFRKVVGNSQEILGGLSMGTHLPKYLNLFFGPV